MLQKIGEKKEERESLSADKAYAASLCVPHLPSRLHALRRDALSRGIPVMEEATLQYLCVLLAALRPRRILEIGTAVGLSAAAMLLTCPHARLTTLESDEKRYEEAGKNLSSFGLSDRVIRHLGDAGEILSMMDGTYDFVFLDGPKAQYGRYMSELKRLLPQGGTVFADDVLLFGWVSGRTPVPPKHRLFVRKMRAYLDALSRDEDFSTVVLDVGGGVALSVRL